MATEALTTGSAEQAGPGGALRQRVLRERAGGGQEPGLVSPSQLPREPLVRFCHREQRGAKAAGLHGSGLKDLPAHAGMFFYFSCRERQLADRTLDPGNGRRALRGGNPQYVRR